MYIIDYTIKRVYIKINTQRYQSFENKKLYFLLIYHIFKGHILFLTKRIFSIQKLEIVNIIKAILEFLLHNQVKF